MEKFKGRLISALHKKWTPRQCFHAGVSTPCRGKIIDAHTVSRSSSLKSISVKNHVYTINIPIDDLGKKDYEFSIKKIGIGRASVFPGFCEKHDAELFSPFERNKFIANIECAFLLGYRSLCHELYTKMNAKEWSIEARSIVADANYIIGESRDIFKNQLSLGYDLSIRDLKEKKYNYDLLFNSDKNNTNFACIEFSSQPEVVCSAYFLPEYDFHGNKLQNITSRGILSGISFNLISRNNGGAFVMHWIDDNPACEKFVNSILRFKEKLLPSVIIEFIFKCFENIYIAPRWWDALDHKVKEKLFLYMGYNTLEQSKPDDLKPDGTTYCTWDDIVITKHY